MWNGPFWIGHILFAALCVMSGLNHFTQAGAMTQYAGSKGMPAAFTMHDFWAVEDEQQRQAEMPQFMKNLALAGTALIFLVLARSPEVVVG